MTPDERFDELARKKLEERSFPFNDAHWKQAEQAIHAQAKGGKRLGWWFGGAALLMLLSTWWWWPVTELGSADVGQIAMTAATVNAVPADPVTVERNMVVTRTEVNAASSGDAPVVAAHEAVEQTGIAEASTTTRSMEEVAMRTTPNTTSIAAQRDVVDHRSNDLVVSTPLTVEFGGIDPEIVADDVPPVDALANGPLSTSVNMDEDTNAESSSGSQEENAFTYIDHDVGPSATDAVPTNDITPAPSSNDAVDAGSAGTVETQKAADSDVMIQSTPSPDVSMVEEPFSVGMISEAPQDSTAEAREPLLSSLVPHNAPWEFGILAGIQTTHTRYSGGNSADWDAASDPVRCATFGAEVMRMGRHFGIGTGLHYGTYAEQLRIDEITTDETNINRYWFLTPVDTTILFITDTINTGGEPQYTGVPMSVTVQVPTQGADTTTSTVVDREARTVINRVSYFEVPLLLDAHLVQGRWQLGLRGGPTLGLLSGRSGTLPNATNDGYTAFTDQAFREVMLGWTARAYVRFRFNAGWSVGVEPMVRGQLFNGLEGGDLSRRSNAWGGMLSLSYRLR